MELLAPGPIFMLGFCVSFALATIGWGSWNQIGLSAETMLVIGLGISSAVLSVVCFRAVEIKVPFGRNSLNSRVEGRVKTWKFVVLICLIAFAFYLRISETYDIGRELGVASSDYSSIAAAVREATAGFKHANALKLDVGFSMLERQMEKVITAVGFVSVYLLSRALTEKNKIEALLSTLSLVLACVFCLVSGGRGGIMYYIIAFFVMLSIRGYRKTGNAQTLTKRLFVVGVITSAVCAVGMFFAAALVGRKSSASLVDYVSFYFGGSAPSLELLLADGDYERAASGVNTFYYVFAPLFKFGVISAYPNYSLGWYSVGGFNSNIFTSFARYYLDFGIAGVALLSFVSMFIMQIVYSIARRRGSGFALLLSGYLGAYAFDCAREEFFFSRLLSMTHVLIIVIAAALLFFLTANRFHSGLIMRCAKKSAGDSHGL